MVRWRHWPVQVRVWPGAALAVAGLLLMPAVHFLLFQHPGFTPGGSAFLYGRLVQDGLAHRWLADHCPADGVRLCDLQQRLPRTADEFLWADSSPFRDLGSWEPESQEELGRLVRATVTAYPAAFAWNSLRLHRCAAGQGGHRRRSRRAPSRHQGRADRGPAPIRPAVHRGPPAAGPGHPAPVQEPEPGARAGRLACHRDVCRCWLCWGCGRGASTAPCWRSSC